MMMMMMMMVIKFKYVKYAINNVLPLFKKYAKISKIKSALF
jgi:hypothetical protein